MFKSPSSAGEFFGKRTWREAAISALGTMWTTRCQEIFVIHKGHEDMLISSSVAGLWNSSFQLLQLQSVEYTPGGEISSTPGNRITIFRLFTQFPILIREYACAALSMTLLSVFSPYVPQSFMIRTPPPGPSIYVFKPLKASVHLSQLPSLT
ncbi:hypothetical protein DFS33DRAFT_808594 [Desarmillaria ectypa]|nr:hypothetical protein DFS33DRAFT_808594 [Desarmillaria ectypa]